MPRCFSSRIRTSERPQAELIAVLSFIRLGIGLMGVSLGTVAAANDDPKPFNKFAAESAEELFVAGAGMTLYGEIPVALFKGADYAHKVGDLAIKREDEVVRGEMILINRDAARLKALHAAGERLDTSLEAQTIRDRLLLLAREMNSGDQNSVGHIADMIGKHWVSVASSLAVNECLEQASKWFFAESIGGRLLRRIFPAGSWAGGLVEGKRSLLRPVFRYGGWRRLGARALKSNQYADKLAEKMADYEMSKVMEEVIGNLGEPSLDALVREALKDHPSRIVLRDRLDRMLALQPAAAAPLPAMPAVATAVADDPVVHAAFQQNYYHQASERANSPSSQPAPAEAPPPVTPAWQTRLHEELKYVGDGKTYQIGPLANYSTNFDGSSNNQKK
jgi:hypothetical protein